MSTLPEVLASTHLESTAVPLNHRPGFNFAQNMAAASVFIYFLIWSWRPLLTDGTLSFSLIRFFFEPYTFKRTSTMCVTSNVKHQKQRKRFQFNFTAPVFIQTFWLGKLDSFVRSDSRDRLTCLATYYSNSRAKRKAINGDVRYWFDALENNENFKVSPVLAKLNLHWVFNYFF